MNVVDSLLIVITSLLHFVRDVLMISLQHQLFVICLFESASSLAAAVPFVVDRVPEYVLHRVMVCFECSEHPRIGGRRGFGVF